MTTQAVQEIIGRAHTDRSFRSQLQSDAPTVYAGFDLTRVEISALSTTDWNSIDHEFQERSQSLLSEALSARFIDMQYG